ADRIAAISTVLEQVNRGETLRQWEATTLTREGASVEVSFNLSPVRDTQGTVVGIAAVARDVGRRRRDPEALRQSEERYRSLVAHLPDVVWVVNESGHPVFVSSNCEAVTGYTLEEICRPDFWFSRIHPEDLPRLAAATDALFRDSQPMNAE